MPGACRWFERKFTFDFPAEKFPDLMERVRGTPARVEELVRGVPAAAATRRDGEAWSIQENVGHLIDLERLHDARIGELLEGRHTLRAADLKNRATFEAGHNKRPMADVLAEFRRVRGEFVARLEALASEQWGLSGLHPRLKTPMRMADLVCFVAEHDDYHLARISELKRKFGVK